MHKENIIAAEVALPCLALNETLQFFLDLGFQLISISPADDPCVASIQGYGVRLRLDRNSTEPPGALRLLTNETSESTCTAPNGTRIVFAPFAPPYVLPPLQSSLIVNTGATKDWVTGRAGMHYRDLLPGRLGGRWIASHIKIEEGGLVPDYVHYHKIRFQMIYCYKGWVRLVYEDQGEPFLLNAGDCVLQPPEIRHRVLESSPGLEVIELSSPALHDTFAEHIITLPTPQYKPEREFSHQRFVRHQAPQAIWKSWRIGGFQCRDLGIEDATHGLASVQVVKRTANAPAQQQRHTQELLFLFLVGGSVTLLVEGDSPQDLSAGGCASIPAGLSYALADASEDLEFLEVLVFARE